MNSAIELYLLSEISNNYKKYKYIMFDWDKLDRNESSRIFVTGYSGAGKTTISEMLGKKYNLPVYSTDHFYEYLDDKPLTKKIEEFELAGDYDSINDLYCENMSRLFTYKKSGIFEGVHIIEYIEETQNTPTLVINTSVLKSTTRAYSRDKLSIQEFILKISNNMRGRKQLMEFINKKLDTTNEVEATNQISFII